MPGICRKAAEADCEAVYRLICELEDCRLPLEAFSAIYETQCGCGNYCCLVCEAEGEIAGVLNLPFENQLHHAARVAEILEFAVAAGCRRQGIGRALFAEAVRRAGEAGCVLLEVACNRRRTDAHSFYVREGMGLSHVRFSKALRGESVFPNERR